MTRGVCRGLDRGLGHELAAIKTAAVLEFPVSGVDFEGVVPVTPQPEQGKVYRKEKRAENPILHGMAAFVDSKVVAGGAGIQDGVTEREGGDFQAAATPVDWAVF